MILHPIIWTALLVVPAGLATMAALPYFGLLAASAWGATRQARRSPPVADRARPWRLTVLVPAHDEESMIAATVTSLLACEYPTTQRRVIVIADNCSDGTAAVAAAAGAEVWVRVDQVERGKGHALKWAMARLFAESGQRRDEHAVVMVDADSVADPGLFWGFVAHLQSGDSWVQALYLGRNPDASWRTQLMTYALALFNGVWLAAQDGMGVSVALRGNGMAFSATGLARQPWAAFGLAEDLEFSWRLRLAGERVRFLGNARILGELVSRGDAAARSQRQRWEHGRKAVRRLFLRELLGLTPLAERLKKTGPVELTGARRLYALLDLTMLPLSKLAAFQFLAAVMAGLALMLPTASDGGLTCAAQLIIAWAGVHLSVLVVYGLSPLWVTGLSWRYLLAARYLPVYVAWKLGLARQDAPGQWVRTGREDR